MNLKRYLLIILLALSLPSATLAVWPGADVNTTTFDSDLDSPLLARPDWFDHAVKFNQVRNHVSTFVQGLLDDIDAATARATLGAAGTGVANTFTQAQTIFKTAAASGLVINGDAAQHSIISLQAAGVTKWDIFRPATTDNFRITETGVSTRFEISPGGAATYTGNWTTTGTHTVTSTLTPQASVDISGAGAGQVKFPATQNASADDNTLDDYEESDVYNPSVGGTATYLTQDGAYTKVGRSVIFQGNVVINVLGTGSTTDVTLPFTQSAATAGTVTVSCLSSVTNVVSMTGVIAVSATVFQIFSRIAASASPALNAIFQGGGPFTNCTFSGVMQI